MGTPPEVFIVGNEQLQIQLRNLQPLPRNPGKPLPISLYRQQHGKRFPFDSTRLFCRVQNHWRISVLTKNR